jgi:hypothetical protein
MKFDAAGNRHGGWCGGVYDTKDVAAFRATVEGFVRGKQLEVIETMYAALDGATERHEAIARSVLKRAMVRLRPHGAAPAADDDKTADAGGSEVATGDVKVDVKADVTADVKVAEPAAASRDGKGEDGKQSKLGELPRDQWWRLFIEGVHHGTADDGLGFDTDQSPGYYDGMMRAFEQELLPAQHDIKMGVMEYELLHELTTVGVRKQVDGMCFGPSYPAMPHERSDASTGGTAYPMVRPGTVPDPAALQELQDEGTLYDPKVMKERNEQLSAEMQQLLAQVRDAKSGAGGDVKIDPVAFKAEVERIQREAERLGNIVNRSLAVVKSGNKDGRPYSNVLTTYDGKAWEAKVGEILADYYGERDAAAADLDAESDDDAPASAPAATSGQTGPTGASTAESAVSISIAPAEPIVSGDHADPVAAGLGLRDHKEPAASSAAGSAVRDHKEQPGAARDQRIAHAKLRAIVRTIRRLHVGHFFTDGNGRVNTFMMLNKLLLAEGFDPVILDDNWIFGGGFTVEQMVAAVTKGMATFRGAVAASRS